MKDFATPLAISGTPEQLQRLSYKLYELGYVSKMLTDDWNERTHIVTNFEDIPYLFTNVHEKFWDGKFETRQKVSADNLPLVLALAAKIKELSIFNEGEIVVATMSSGPQPHNYQKGLLYKVTKQSNYNIETESLCEDKYLNGWNKENFRKATVEEIKTHFGYYPPEEKKEGKKLLGYKVRNGINREAAVSILNDGEKFDPYSGIIEFCHNSHFLEVAKRLGVLEALFEPIYEEEFNVGDYVFIECGGSGAYGADNEVGIIMPPETEAESGSSPSKLKVKIFGTVWALNSEHQAFSMRKATEDEIKSTQLRRIVLKCAEGSFQLEVSKKGIFYRPENTWLNPADIKTILEKLKKFQDREKPKNVWGSKTSEHGPKSFSSERGYNFSFNVSSIDMGCMKAVSIQAFMDVLKIYEQFQK